MKISLVQMISSADKEENLKKSLDVIRGLSSEKPDLIIFPEYHMYMPDFANPGIAKDVSEPTDGNFVTILSQASEKIGSNLLLNMVETNFGSLKPFNTSLLIDDLGVVAGKYRKIHLFDAYAMQESSVYDPGRIPIKAMNNEKFRIGVQICYDLRFPEPSRLLTLQGAQILSYQAGWFAGNRKLETWRTLLKARAIENGVFVLGTAQCGEKFTGHSMVISPYGDVIRESDNSETVLTETLDMSLIERYREEVPMMKQRRKDMYDVSGL